MPSPHVSDLGDPHSQQVLTCPCGDVTYLDKTTPTWQDDFGSWLDQHGDHVETMGGMPDGHRSS